MSAKTRHHAGCDRGRSSIIQFRGRNRAGDRVPPVSTELVNPIESSSVPFLECFLRQLSKLKVVVVDLDQFTRLPRRVNRVSFTGRATSGASISQRFRRLAFPWVCGGWAEPKSKE